MSDLVQSPMYDAVLVVSFGGPESMQDVMPFLENVLRGRNVPQERMLEVAKHYELFGGVSPINAQNRELIAALEKQLQSSGPTLPVYFGNRNWHPLLPDTLRKMRDDGIRNAIAFVTSAYSSYSGCRQYLENIEAAREAAGPGAPKVEKIRQFYNHPKFILANVEQVRRSFSQFAEENRPGVHLIFTAHSIPVSMAQNCKYEEQLREACRLVASQLGIERYDLAFQSRSGPPSIPWLGPDILEHLQTLKARGLTDVVICPIGFVSDHMEVIYDLDVEARRLCDDLGVNMKRAATAGTHPAFIEMIRELILERINPGPATDGDNASLPACDIGCCPAR